MVKHALYRFSHWSIHAVSCLGKITRLATVAPTTDKVTMVLKKCIFVTCVDVERIYFASLGIAGQLCDQSLRIEDIMKKRRQPVRRDDGSCKSVIHGNTT